MLNKQLIITYEDAIFEAERFLEKANKSFEELKSGKNINHSKSNASTKRSSMDLSNALIELRK